MLDYSALSSKCPTEPIIPAILRLLVEWRYFPNKLLPSVTSFLSSAVTHRVCSCGFPLLHSSPIGRQRRSIHLSTQGRKHTLTPVLSITWSARSTRRKIQDKAPLHRKLQCRSRCLCRQFLLFLSLFHVNCLLAQQHDFIASGQRPTIIHGGRSHYGYQ